MYEQKCRINRPLLHLFFCHSSRAVSYCDEWQRVTPMQSAFAAHQGRGGARTTMISVNSSKTGVGRRLYKTNRSLLTLFFHHSLRAMTNLNKWQWLLPLQSPSAAAAMSEGALGGQHRHCPCFGFVEMLEQGAKAKPFYNIVNNSGCWESKRVNIRFYPKDSSGATG